MIRSAKAEDIDVLARLDRSSFAVHAWSADQVRKELDAGRLIVAVDPDGAVEGYASVTIGDDVAELFRIVVAADALRQGIGTSLLAAAMDRARASRVEKMLLEVAENNAAAIALYESAGFEALSRRRGYYRGIDAVVMVKEFR